MSLVWQLLVRRLRAWGTIGAAQGQVKGPSGKAQAESIQQNQQSMQQMGLQDMQRLCSSSSCNQHSQLLKIIRVVMPGNGVLQAEREWSVRFGLSAQ